MVLVVLFEFILLACKVFTYNNNKMTETDATKLPLSMPETFIPYLDKYRIYKTFKDMLQDLLIHLPRDHLKHMKVFMSRNAHSTADTENVILLVSDELNIDVKNLVKELIKDLGFFVITRRCVMDRCEMHDDYDPRCVSTALMSQVTKQMALKEPVLCAGWLMFDHPCTVREARCLQQDGVLPTVTLYLRPPPPAAPPAHNANTAPRSFWKQDIEGLKWAYQATLKEVWISPEDADDTEKMATKCFNAMRACSAGLQASGQGFHVLGAPSYYRVLLIGPRYSGCKTQARLLARHFNLVALSFEELCAEARERKDEVGEKLRSYGPNIQLKAEIVKRRLLQKDCVDHGWVLTGYPTTGIDFEKLDNMPTPPNRVIFLNVEWATCKARAMAEGVDWCTGQSAAAGSGPRVRMRPTDTESQIDFELETYFTESLAELRAAAGITAVEISGMESPEEIQTKIQAAVISAPAFDIVNCAQIRNVLVD